MNFTDKVAVVTGGANGIGRCIVETFLSVGARVAFIDTDEESGVSIAANYQQDRVLFVSGDIADEDTLDFFSKKIAELFGNVDYLVNNACIFTKGGILSDCSFDDFNQVLAIGVTAPYMLSKLLLPLFNEQAAIVNISSTRAHMSQPNTEPYSAAKGGLYALTHALSVSLSGKVRVNCINPGWIDTGGFHGDTDYIPTFEDVDYEQHPVGRIGRPADVATLTLFLCSTYATFITGQDINVDGGMSKLMIYNNSQGWKYAPE